MWTDREMIDRLDVKIDRIERQISSIKDIVFVCWLIQVALIGYLIWTA